MMPRVRWARSVVRRLAHLGLAMFASWPAASIAEAQAGHAGAMGSMAMDRVIRTFLLADQLELQVNAPERPVNLEFVSWIGGDYRRLVLRAQGEQATRGRATGELQADVLFGRLVTPFWTAVGGVRVDSRSRLDNRRADIVTVGNAGTRPRVTRGMLALGFEGLAPGWLLLEPTLLVSTAGDVSLEVETSVDLMLTQRLIVQPRVELNAAVQAVPEIGVGSGFNDVELGLRLRYEVRRKVAPYLGVSWQRRTGATAAMMHAAGEPSGVGSVTAGVRVWR